jgi:hypothetical protein
MQTLPGQEQFHPTTVGTQTRTVVLAAIILFALAGLLSGFAVGAFVRPNKTTPIALPNQLSNLPKTKIKKTSITTTVPVQIIPLGEPVIDTYQFSEIANGSTTYTFTGHVVDKQNAPVRASGITCKIWLTKNGNVNPNITEDRLQSVSTLDQPFPKEAQGDLLFASATPQTQMCASGQGNWSYQIAPTTKAGQYYIVLLTDWNGVHYNWKWIAIRIQGQG